MKYQHRLGLYFLIVGFGLVVISDTRWIIWAGAAILTIGTVLFLEG